MNERRAGDLPLGDMIDFDLLAEELRRLARVDALLRAAAAHDRHDAAAPASGLGRGDAGGEGRCARW